MSEYEYRCLACEHTFSDIVPMKQYKKRRKCPECKEHKLERVIGNVTSFVKGEAKTLEHLAARNTEKMGSYELGDKRGKHEEASKKGKKVAGTNEPWYNKKGTATSQEISKMTPQQKARYIEKGTK